MSDYESICETIARNNLALDDRRYDDCLATYAPDGSIAGRTGHAAIREFMMSQDLAKRPELQRRHVNSNIVAEVGGDNAEVGGDNAEVGGDNAEVGGDNAEVDADSADGDTAEVTSDLFVYDKVDGGAWALTAVGRYRDRLARQADGRWLFTSRELTFL
jgi:hypothetical protein